MGYVEQSLGANEVVHYRARKPFLLRAFGWCVLLLTIAIAAEIYRHGYDFLAAVGGIAGLILFLFIMVPVWTTEIAVTNHRVIFKRGLLRRDVSDLQLRSIEQVGLKQGLLGRLFNMGNVEIHGTGVDDVRLPAIADPVALQRSIQEAMGASQPAAAPAPARRA